MQLSGQRSVDKNILLRRLRHLHHSRLRSRCSRGLPPVRLLQPRRQQIRRPSNPRTLRGPSSQPENGGTPGAKGGPAPPQGSSARRNRSRRRERKEVENRAPVRPWGVRGYYSARNGFVCCKIGEAIMVWQQQAVREINKDLDAVVICIFFNRIGT